MSVWNRLMKKIEFDPKELKNSKRIFKSATPKYTLDWYVKWTASVVLLFAFTVRGIPEYIFYDAVLSILGLALWLWVSILWKDRALMLLNGVGLILVTRNLITSLLV